jgi:adenylate cyclase
MMLRAPDPRAGIELGVAIVREAESIPGFPPVRVGIHHGTAVERNGDWYGNTVNVASRLCSAAGGGEVLVSDTVREQLDPTEIATRRRWRFKPKGAPKGLQAYVAERQPAT